MVDGKWERADETNVHTTCEILVFTDFLDLEAKFETSELFVIEAEEEYRFAGAIGKTGNSRAGAQATQGLANAEKCGADDQGGIELC